MVSDSELDPGLVAPEVRMARQREFVVERGLDLLKEAYDATVESGDQDYAQEAA